MKKNLKFNLTKRERQVADYWYTVGQHKAYLDIHDKLKPLSMTLTAKINNLAIDMMTMEDKARGVK